MTGWIDSVRGASVAAVAAKLKLPTRARGRKQYVVCPACQQPTRHRRTGDKRLSADIVHQGSGWVCYQCDARGDAIDFAAYALGGRRFAHADPTTRDRVRELFEGQVSIIGLPAASPAPEARVPRFLPEEELQAAWEACVPVTDDTEVANYLTGRGIDAGAVARGDLARALPSDGKTYPWMRHRPHAQRGAGTWADTGHRLIVPLVDAKGIRRSFIARLSREPVEGERKSSPPFGYDRSGLLMACPTALRMLSLGTRPFADERTFRLYATEGEIDFLAFASRLHADDEKRVRAVIGIVNGSLTTELGKRIPPGTEVVSLFDRDEQGGRYDAQLKRILPSSCSFGSWRN